MPEKYSVHDGGGLPCREDGQPSVQEFDRDADGEDTPLRMQDLKQDGLSFFHCFLQYA